MIAALFLSVLSTPTLPTPRPFVQQEEGGKSEAPAPDAAAAEADAKIAAAGEDIAQLLELAKAFKDGDQKDASKKAYERVIEIEPDHKDAHKALRHHNYDGQWFESYAALSKYRREETAKMKDKGLARWKDEWVPEGDVPYLNMGWLKDEKGGWTDPIATAREKQVAEWKEAGYTFRPDDSTWVAPDEKTQWEAQLWKCGEEWLDIAKANEYHGQIGQWWQRDGERFVAWSTCDWDGANWASWYADQTYPDLVRLFGVQPAKKPHFVVLNSLDQYNQAAGGQPPLLPETEGISSLHGAYFSDVFFAPDPLTQGPMYLGCGVSYWDRNDEKLAPWGPFWLRWAAAQSYCEAIDPSWMAVSEFIAAANGGAQPNANTFWTEKKIPRWMRYGAASYAERFMRDPQAGEGNPWGLREFAFGQLAEGGSLHKIEDIFAFQLDLNDIEGSSRLYHEAGLVVSFLLDGADGDKKMRERHQAFKAALKASLAGTAKEKDLAEAVEKLEKELAKNEKDIKKFAGI